LIKVTYFRSDDKFVSPTFFDGSFRWRRAVLEATHMLIENEFKTEETHPDYRIEVSSPKGHPIRVGSAWMAKSNRTGNDYVSVRVVAFDEAPTVTITSEGWRGSNSWFTKTMVLALER